MNLKTSVDRLFCFYLQYKLSTYAISVIYFFNNPIYAIDRTFFSHTCLTAKALRRITMLGFLVGTIKAEKSTLKCVQLRFSG